ncbi:coiled-coil domain-containing protein 97 [Musca vetustissima]|uniref:coiled-coil domain-containing protein 97 n=1 Tax=Musca vetustissima TaxID=27455 RepID=UPI002AB7C2EE|nr:coiled-coil domain-containing protein 97 [Musca vetustissima]
MTADTEEIHPGDNQKLTTIDNTKENQKPLPQEIMEILKDLSENSKIVFKSQQRGDPELLQSEKIQLAKDVYQRNPQTFLIRFGSYMQQKHLEDFARLSIADSDEEMHSMVSEYQRKLKTRAQDVKNRRYVALQRLIEGGEYFSEQEMMKRSPELYHELVGQHLSKEERQLRDSYDVKNTTFSGILMHNMERDEITKIMEEAEKKAIETQSDESRESTNSPISITEINEGSNPKDTIFDEIDSVVPQNFQQQWGNFDNEQQACSSSKIEKKKAKKKPEVTNKIIPLKNLITADERELLRQEFISQMHESFLNGQDSDFDYATVDDNTQYDDLETLNQDREDKYFEEDSDEEDDGGDGKANDTGTMEQSESEDELDVYMNHLNKHFSLQK